MKTGTEIRKEIEELENKISELRQKLYKIENKENKEIADKMIGKCFRVLGTGTWETYRILYKKSKNGYYYFKEFSSNTTDKNGYVYVNSFSVNRTDDVIRKTKLEREISLEEFKTKVKEMIDNYHSNWYEMITEHLNEVIQN